VVVVTERQDVFQRVQVSAFGDVLVNRLARRVPGRDVDPEFELFDYSWGDDMARFGVTRGNVGERLHCGFIEMVFINVSREHAPVAVADERLGASGVHSPY
jgi:uncharacterized protein (DUF2235 family)